MSEQATIEATPVSESTPDAPGISRQEAIDAAWAKTNEPQSEEAPAPTGEPEITAENLNEKPERASVAGSIREFIRARQPKVEPEKTGLEAEVAQLRGALDAIAKNGGETQEPSREELLLQKFEELQAQQAAQLEAEAEAKEREAFEQQVAALRAGALENINAVAETEYPGLAALEQQETVVNALFQRLEEGQETSEDEIASEVEAGLREVYQKLHAVYQGSTTPSEATKAPSERQQTLSPTLSGADEQADLSKMTRQEKIDYLWNKSKTS